jgi:hypothetical protein
MNILNYLDNQLEIFKQKNNNYPTLIIMNKEMKDKIFAELFKFSDLSLCWADKKDNYKGIKIKIKKDTQLELK